METYNFIDIEHTLRKEEDAKINPDIFGNAFTAFLKHEKPDVLVISDTHIGAIGSYPTIFDRCLDTLLQNDNTVQALLIIGDFFDYICEDAASITKDAGIKNIYGKLEKLCKNIAVKIALGNHEIPIEGDFAKHRDSFVKTFTQHAGGNFPGFLVPDNFCQFICISNQDDNLDLSIHDDLKTLGKAMESIILLAHGYQFFPGENAVAGPIWKACLNDRPEDKNTIDILYNARINPQHKETTKTIQNSINKGNFDAYMERVHQKEAWKKTRSMHNIFGYYRKREIKKFLQGNNLSSIAAVVYGHTHKAEHGRVSLKSKTKVEIYNTGAWQHINPTLIGIKIEDGGFSLCHKTWNMKTNQFLDVE